MSLAALKPLQVLVLVAKYVDLYDGDALQVDKAQFEKILSYIEHGKREGATLLTGGKPIGNKGYYIEPTIFTDVKVQIQLCSKVLIFRNNYRLK